MHDMHEMSRHVQTCPEMSRHVQRCPEMSRDVQRCPDMSRHVQRCPEMSRDVQTSPDMSRDIQRCRKTSRHVQTCPDMSGHVWTWLDTLDTGPKIEWKVVTNSPEQISAREGRTGTHGAPPGALSPMPSPGAWAPWTRGCASLAGCFADHPGVFGHLPRCEWQL